VTRKLRIGVLFGGQSGEHEVSIVSARAVMNGLDPDKYDVVPIGITKEGRWLTGGDPMAALTAAADPKLLPTSAAENQEPGTKNQESSAMVPLETADAASLTTTGSGSSILSSINVVFPVLHGPRGEDGAIQGLLELVGVAYVGCGVLASSVGLDKAMMKHAFAAARLPLLPWLMLRRVDWERDPQQAMNLVESQLRYPVFVKPANMGSSVGVGKATDRATLEQCIAEAARYDRRIVVEQGINAREIEISVLGNDEPQASIPGEIVPSKDWYDYEAKYLDGASQTLLPAPISPALTEQVRELAIRAFKAIDGAGLARVDFLLDRDTETLYINEVNTMPGFTPISMYAKMWEASGLSYRELLNRLIELALERHSATKDEGRKTKA
jgi:D-alanine-D-alanine ligase